MAISLLIILLNTFIVVRSWILLAKRKIAPSLAMWVFFLVAIGTSLFTYLASGSYTLADNMLNTADLGMAVLVIAGILIFGDPSTRFSRFDFLCLFLVLLILTYWWLSGNPETTHLLVQAVMVIAYFPVVHRLITTRRNSESFLVWTAMLLAPVLSLFQAKGELALIYTWRAIVSVSLLLILMFWVSVQQTKE